MRRCTPTTRSQLFARERAAEIAGETAGLLAPLLAQEPHRIAALTTGQAARRAGRGGGCNTALVDVEVC
ncbi:hypothetical protein ABZ471_13600 [Streptomyces sp. NPDC005728]|uniref:hypothetical protein n=1 Tax=Streptomyces sp. NPDC005728 TaxID=3157054 RepID=UPI0033E04405